MLYMVKGNKGRLVKLEEDIRLSDGTVIFQLPDEDDLLPIVSSTQTPPIGIDDPESAIELDMIDGLSEGALDTIRELDGAIAFYRYKGEFYVTDESLDLSMPRWKGLTLSEMEYWLEHVTVK